MPENNIPRWQNHAADAPPTDEGGLRAPAHLGFWAKTWWWFDFVILVNLARFRFIAILVAIGLVIIMWDTIIAYYDKWTRPAAQQQTASSDFEYFCPMHPTVVRDKPKEKCPICFMPLSKRKKGDSHDEALAPGIVNRVQLSPYRVVLAGVRTWKVSYVPLTKEITTVGSVEFNERELKHVAARVKGRLDKLFVNETGQMVHKGEELASLYSPDLVVTVQNLIDAQRNKNDELLRIARDRLELWDISAKQIDDILATRKANTHLKIRSPIKGHVLKKYVKEGQYVDEGSPLYDVVDLTTVWIQAQVYEEDMAFLPFQHHALSKDQAEKIGLPVTASTRAFPGQTFPGKLSFVFPHVDENTRSVMIRYELENLDHKLRPGTSVTIKLNIPPKKLALFETTVADDWMSATAADVMGQTLIGQWRGAGWQPLVQASIQKLLVEQGLILAVPDTSVIDTGALQIVYREVAPGEYEGVKVELGPRMQRADGKVFFPVLRGLAADDMIVTAGAFLVDAETRLNPAAGSIYFGGSGGKGGAGGSVKPSTPDDMEAKIKLAMGKLTVEDRRLAEAQKICPVLKDSPLGSMGVPIKLMIQDQPVFLCCKNCEKGALANPKKTLDEVATLKSKIK
jgi:membrane fusion protein, copper/silver efflux system